MNRWYSEENDAENLYAKALDRIPKEHYAEYDSLVHSGWRRAAKRLIARINLKSSEDYSKIIADYESNLCKAREIPGAENAVKIANIRGLVPLHIATSRAWTAEKTLNEVLKDLGEE